MSITSGVRAWLKTCPGLAGEQIHVDWLPENARAYSVIPQPVNPALTEYCDGSSLRQAAYTIASREFLASDITVALENLDWYEDFSDWLDECNYRRRYPDLGNGRVCQSVRLQSSGYPLATDYTGMAQYQAQITITYYQSPTWAISEEG